MDTKNRESLSVVEQNDNMSTESELDKPELKSAVNKLPLLRSRASPLDRDIWKSRLKEELQALISYIKLQKCQGEVWFSIKPETPSGERFEGQCWHYIDSRRYQFDFFFDIPVGYPSVAPDICIPELIGKTAKMYHGGKICLTAHFHPLWSRNVPHFGIAHLLALGLGPWLAAEVPDLIARGKIAPF